jgi:hypothetical protein
MAWSPVRRTNAGRFEVDHPGDYATLNSYHPSDATGGGAVIALISTQIAVVINHWLANRREQRKEDAGRQQQRREILRTKLEEIMGLLTARLTELQARSQLPIPLAATLAAGTAMPGTYSEAALVGNSMIQANMLVDLYFHELIGDVLSLAELERDFRHFLDKEFEALNRDPRAWLETFARTYPDRSSAREDGVKNKLVDIQLKARKILQSQLL